MKFVKSEGYIELANAMANVINNALTENKKVLWLISGGSNIKVATQTKSLLKSTKNLIIVLIDERYGDTGHKDSNYKQLIDAGFNIAGTEFKDILINEPFESTVFKYNKYIEQVFAIKHTAIGLFGVGEDGHTAGILPNSPATDENAKTWVVGYKSNDYKRITLTPYALSHINTAYVGAYGNTKQPTLSRLRNENTSIAIQPAQLLKQLPEVYIYNDLIGE